MHEPEADPTSDDFAPTDEHAPTPLGFRIVRSLMLLAASIVLLFGIPMLSWMLGTTLAREGVEVDGKNYLVSVTRRGRVTVWFEGPDGTTHEDIVGPDEELPRGPATIVSEDDGRTIVVEVGEITTRYEYVDGTFERAE